MDIVVCHTEGCTNAECEVLLDLTVRDDQTGVVTTVQTVVCGVCDQRITDIRREG